MALTPVILSTSPRATPINTAGAGRPGLICALVSDKHAIPVRISSSPRATKALLGSGSFNFGTPNAPLPAGATFARASVGWYFEGENYVRNPTMVGTVAGTPGTLPTNWLIGGNVTGVTRTIVGVGLEDNLPYIDFQFAGTTPTTTFFGTEFDTRTSLNGIPALAGETWVAQTYVRLIAGSWTNITVAQTIAEWTSAGAASGASTSSNFVPTNASLRSQRFSFTRLLNGGTTAVVNNYVRFNTTAGMPFDFTVRIGLPTMTTVSKPFVPRLTAANTNAPRYTYNQLTGAYEGLLVEPASFSGVRNNSMTGAVVGTPGTLPNTWSSPLTSSSGVPFQVVGLPVVNGMQCIDIRWQGTPSANNYVVLFESGSNVPIAGAQTISESLYLALIAGNFSNLNSLTLLTTFSPTGSAASSDLRGQIDATLRRFSFAGNSPVGTTAGLPRLNCTVNAGQPVDFTLRFGVAMLEVQPLATSPILATSVNVNRAADVFTVPLANGTYNIALQRVSGVTMDNNVVISGGSYTVPPHASPLINIVPSRIA